MREINIDDYIDSLPLGCSQYRSKIKQEFESFAKDILELAAENAEAYYYHDMEQYEANINEESILKTIKQVEL